MLSRQRTKALIRLICTFVVRIGHNRFSHDVAHLQSSLLWNKGMIILTKFFQISFCWILIFSYNRWWSFFLFGFYGPSRLFRSFWSVSIVRWDMNRRALKKKNTWPPASITWLFSNLTSLLHRNDMSPVKRICVFEHSVMINFNCECPAIQRGQGSGFLTEGSSWLTACMSV